MENKKQKNSVAGWPNASKDTGEKYIYLKVNYNGDEIEFNMYRNKYKTKPNQPDFFGLQIIRPGKNKQQIQQEENDDIGF